MPKARAQRWHPRSLAIGKKRRFQGFPAKLLKSCENPGLPGKSFLTAFLIQIGDHLPHEKVASSQQVGDLGRSSLGHPSCSKTARKIGWGPTSNDRNGAGSSLSDIGLAKGERGHRSICCCCPLSARSGHCKTRFIPLTWGEERTVGLRLDLVTFECCGTSPMPARLYAPYYIDGSNRIGGYGLTSMLRSFLMETMPTRTDDRGPQNSDDKNKGACFNKMRLEQRQAAHLTHLSNSEIDGCIVAVEVAFDAAWLAASGDHQIQKLWKRQDAAATNELVNLGYVLQEADKKKPGLAAMFASKIKKQDINNQRGLLFELLVIGGMFAPHGKVEPTAANQPGYDLRIIYNDGAELFLSLKSWGSSQHERIFRKKASDLEQHVRKLALRSKCYSVNVRVAAAGCPDENAWGALRAAISDNLREQPLVRSSFAVGSEWGLAIGPVWSPNGPISRNNVSHEVFALSPYHRNEIANFTDKLKGAIANAEKYATVRPGRMHGIVIRVPANLSWSDANDVASNSLSENQSGLIGMIVLVQAAVISDTDGRSSQHVYVKPHVSASYVAWLSAKRGFGLKLKLATIGSEASRSVLTIDDGHQVDLNNMYHYHSGDIFVRFDGSEGTVSRLAPGLRQHAVIKVGEKELVVSGRFAENDDLVLFD